MTIVQAIVLGIIQGLTEFLPVSSSGHLVFIPHLFGWTDQGLAFDVVMHVGTLVAVVVYFRDRLWGIVKSFVGRGHSESISVPLKREEGSINNRKLGWLLLLTIIPAGIVGLFFGDAIEANLRLPVVIGVGLIFWGVVLWIADYLSRKHGSTKALKHVGWKEAVFIGCMQAIALIPGTSRSGITMTAGLFSGLSKKTAAEFSFLMSVPIIMIAGFVGILDMASASESVAFVPLTAGFISSMLSGFVAIWGLMKILQKWSFMPFVVYRIVVGMLILIFLV